MTGDLADIELLYSPGCPHLGLARERLARAMERIGLGETPIRFREVPDASGSWAGSPTYLVAGVDLFPTGSAPGGPACRIYGASERTEGAPSIEALTEALLKRAEETRL